MGYCLHVLQQGHKWPQFVDETAITALLRAGSKVSHPCPAHLPCVMSLVQPCSPAVPWALRFSAELSNSKITVSIAQSKATSGLPEIHGKLRWTNSQHQLLLIGVSEIFALTFQYSALCAHYEIQHTIVSYHLVDGVHVSMLAVSSTTAHHSAPAQLPRVDATAHFVEQTPFVCLSL